MKNLLKRAYNLKKGSAMIIGALAMIIASNATSMCGLGGFYELEMPKSLYMTEE